MKPETLAAFQVWLKDRCDFCMLQGRLTTSEEDKQLWRARLTVHHEVERQIDWLLDKEKR